MTNTKINTEELYKLINMLIAQGIPFELSEHMGVPHIEYPSKKNRICSVICNEVSYGHEAGLLEIFGLLTKEELEYDEVIGFLTAYNVFERISTHYHSNQNIIKELVCQ